MVHAACDVAPAIGWRGAQKERTRRLAAAVQGAQLELRRAGASGADTAAGNAGGAGPDTNPSRRKSSLNRHNTPAVKDLRDLKRSGEQAEFASPLIEEAEVIHEGDEEEGGEEEAAGSAAAGSAVQAARALRE